MIPVTKPFLPPLEEYIEVLEGVWERNHLTNNGPITRKLEQVLSDRFGGVGTLLTGNGTIAIQIALKALNIEGKVITTPFSYVATTSSIVWENCEPVFADIDPETYNIDPESVRALVTPETEAILATHCFGVPCDIEALEEIAKSNGLKLVFDAAHCFDSTYKGKSVFGYGDISTCSFHATKLFHTVEGGAVFSQDTDLIEKMGFMRNFGHNGPENFNEVGINGKISEFHAAMGMINLKYIEVVKKKREEQFDLYCRLLNASYLKVLKSEVPAIWCSNKSYFPVLLRSSEKMAEVKNALERSNIFPRRYFYPSLSSLPYTGGWDTPVSDDISSRILCLPLYHGLLKDDISEIASIINRTL